MWKRLVIGGLLMVATGACGLTVGGPQARWPREGGSPTATPPATSRSTVPIYSTLNDPPSIVARWGEWNVRKAYIMYQQHFDPKHTNRWGAKDLTYRWLGENVPPDFDGPLCIDWEAHVLEILARGPTNNPEWQPAVNEMLALLKYVREQRPRAKVGYYAIPQTPYWNQPPEHADRMLALKPIFDASNALFPSAYDLYGENPQRDHQIYGDRMKLALRCAAGKPVYVITWHRYHDSTAKWGFSLIPKQEYIDHVRNLVTAEWQGDRVDGVITWGEDRYWYNASRARKPDGTFTNTGTNWDRVRQRFSQEKQESMPIDAYLERLFERVYCRLHEAVHGVPCKLDP
jgi:hypothetical protein